MLLRFVLNLFFCQHEGMVRETVTDGAVDRRVLRCPRCGYTVPQIGRTEDETRKAQASGQPAHERMRARPKGEIVRGRFKQRGRIA